MNPYQTYMAIKAAGMESRLAHAGVGAATGFLSTKLTPPEPVRWNADGTLHETSKGERRKNELIGAAVGAGLGLGVGPLFKKLASMEKVAGPFDVFSPAPQRQYDPRTHADVFRAKSNFTRSRLVYQQTFRKLEPKAKKEILKAYDDYQNTVEGAILAGRYPMGTY